MPGPLLSARFDVDTKPAEKSFENHMKKVTRKMSQEADIRGVSKTIYGKALFPSMRERAGGLVPNVVKQGLKKASALMSETMFGRGSKSLMTGGKKAFTSMADGLKGVTNQAKSATKALLDMAKAAKQSVMGKPGSVRHRTMSGIAGGARRLGGGLARGAMRGASFGMGSLLGFATSALTQGIGNFEQVQQARLKGATMAGPEGLKYASGQKWGYNSAKAAELQARAARMGLSGSVKSVGKVQGGQISQVLERGLGAGGVEMGGALSRRTGASSQSILRTLSAAFTVAVKTGLDTSRVMEALEAGNRFAEEQIAITPGKDAFKDFTQELGRLQMSGSKGLMGRYGAAQLNRMNASIQNASGPQQALIQRAFGFGKGTSYYDVLKKQEMGARGGNVQAIMEQLQKEYGSSEKGGLSESGRIAFKRMGFGSLHMAEKMEKVYLQQKTGKISPEEAQQKVRSIYEEAADKKLPPLQRRAYEVISRFGGVSKLMAARFDKLAAFGAKNYGIKETLTKIQMDMVDQVKPIAETIKDILPTLRDILRTTLPIISKGIQAAVHGIKLLIAGFKGFFGGIKSFKGSKSNPLNWGSLMKAGGEGSLLAMGDVEKKYTEAGTKTIKKALSDSTLKKKLESTASPDKPQFDFSKVQQGGTNTFNFTVQATLEPLPGGKATSKKKSVQVTQGAGKPAKIEKK